MITNRLENLLTQDVDGSFDISNISSENIGDVEKELKTAKENVTKLHKYFVLLRLEETDDAAEEELEKEVENYLKEVDEKYDKAALLVDKYRRQLMKEKELPREREKLYHVWLVKKVQKIRIILLCCTRLANVKFGKI